MAELGATKDLFRRILSATVRSVHPRELISNYLTVSEKGELVVKNAKAGLNSYQICDNLYVIGFGKAAYEMGSQVDTILRNRIKSAILIVPDGYLSRVTTPISGTFTIFEGAKNNLPDTRAVEAASKIKELCQQLTAKDLLLVLISGGGSALLPAPTPPLTLEEKAFVIKALSKRGADITQLNSVRKNLSDLKGGKLASIAYPAQVVSLILSDLMGGRTDMVASGPTFPNNDRPGLAREIIEKYLTASEIPENAKRVMESTMPSHEIDWSKVNNILMADNSTATNAAKNEFTQAGYQCVVISNEVSGTIENVANFYAQLVENFCSYLMNNITENDFLQNSDQILGKWNIPPLEKNFFRNFSRKGEKFCFVAGGEPTVIVKGKGRGGRNQELALRIGVHLNNLKTRNAWLNNFEILFASAGTDGIDGNSAAAGAMSYIELMENAGRENLPTVTTYIDNNDSCSFYERFNNGRDHIITGHTGTNVMDVHFLSVRQKLMSS